MKKQTGFTLIELVAVIILMGILTIFIAPRFSTSSGFSEHALRERVISALRFAQQSALNDHSPNACYRYFSDNDGFAAQFSTTPNTAANFSTSFTAIANTETRLSADNNSRDFAGINFSQGAVIYFNRNGELSSQPHCEGVAGAAQTLTISGNETLSLRVSPAGYVQRN